MPPSLFVTAASLIALAVGVVSALFPSVILSSKGVDPSLAAECWVRQGGVALIGIGVTAWRLRAFATHAVARAFFIGNAVHQVLLAPIEVVAWLEGTITKVSGIVPNTLLHVVLAAGFSWLAWRLRAPAAR